MALGEVPAEVSEVVGFRKVSGVPRKVPEGFGFCAGSRRFFSGHLVWDITFSHECLAALGSFCAGG